MVHQSTYNFSVSGTWAAKCAYALELLNDGARLATERLVLKP